MGFVNVTIDGRQVQAEAGQTVLDAAKANGINIPVLCHHPALPPEGACRICLVEVEKQRNLHPACTYPVSEGMVVHTESERVQAARRFVLQLLFSERQHYCMYCAMSGSEATSDCELQKLGYRYQLDNWEYAPDYSRRWPVDASRQYFILDHSRCILCRRCVRACDEIAANHTLGVRERGARTMVTADDGIPFGASSCVSCGTCLQVCPTGALMDRRSAYMGHTAEGDLAKGTCMGCSVGCGIEALTRGNLLLKVNGDWDAANGGLLCAEGRFGVLEPAPERLASPLVRKDGRLTATTWDEALAHVARRLAAAHTVAGLISPRATNEALAAFGRFFREALAGAQAGLLYGEAPPQDLGPLAGLPDVAAADCIVLVDADPLEEQKVVGYFVKRALDRDARLIVAGDAGTALDARAQQRVALSRLPEVPGLIAGAARPVVVYGPGLRPEAYASLRGLPAGTRYLPLVKGTNAAGAARLGLAARPVQGSALYVQAGDERPDGRSLPAADFMVVQSAYRTEWTETADVVLPAQLWSEKDGTIVNLEGRVLRVAPFTSMPDGVLADPAPLGRLATLLGHPAL